MGIRYYAVSAASISDALDSSSTTDLHTVCYRFVEGVDAEACRPLDDVMVVDEEPSEDAKPTAVGYSSDTNVPPATANAARPSRTYIKQNDIKAEDDVVYGQGNNDPGMSRWCDLCDNVRNEVEEYNSKAHATRIVDTIMNKGGRFIDREYKPTKFYAMSKEDAIELTEQAFHRVPIVDFDPETDVVMGRGGKANRNPANQAWRKNVYSKQPTYRRQNKRSDKTEISREIVRLNYNKGRRFVTDETSVKNRFYLVPEAEAVRKTSQCLRETKSKKRSVSMP